MIIRAFLLVTLAHLTQGEVLELTDTTFDTVVRSKDAILVNFFAPWCTYSRRLIPHYQYAASVLKRSKPPIDIAKVDCFGKGAYTCGRYRIKNYPVLKLFKHGLETHTYDGRNTYSSIVRYMKRNTGPNAPVHGGWGEWSAFTTCSVTCGVGQQMRSRDCNSPPPSNGGERCKGDGVERVKCVSGSCADACKVCKCSTKKNLYGENKSNVGKTVNCRNVGLTSIPRNIPEDVATLDLSRNAITDIPPDSFNNYTNLQTLSLDKNRIRALSSSAFDSLVHLRRLSMFQNQLKTLPVGVFKGLVKLEGLLLSNNIIEALPHAVFDELTNLKFLSLHTNRLSVLPKDVFSNLLHLTNLQLYNNRLTAIPYTALSPLKNLQTLDLHDNKLNNLNGNPFLGLDKVRRLMLSDNDINEIDAGAFKGLSNLKWLDLKGNSLTSLPESVFSSQRVGHLRRINLSRNPLQCSCTLYKALKPYLRKVWGTCDGRRQLRSMRRQGC